MRPLRRQVLGTGALAGIAVAVAVIGVAAVFARRARAVRCEPVALVAVAAPRRR